MRRQLKIVGLPITSVCNLRCTHCLRNRVSKYGSCVWNMSVKQAALIASKIRDYSDYVNISAGYGETFLNPNVSTIISVFNDHDIKTVAYSNATPATINSITNSHVHLLLLSVDRFHFEFNSKSVEQLLNIYQNEVRFATNIHLNIVLHPRKDESKLIDYIKSLCFNHPTVIAEFHWLMPYETVFEKTTTLPIYYQSLLSFGKQFLLPSSTYSFQNKCSDIFNSLYFDEEGNVRSCCVYMDAYSELNIYKDDIPTIFHSDYLEEKRKYFASHNGFTTCFNCPIGHGFIW